MDSTIILGCIGSFVGGISIASWMFSIGENKRVQRQINRLYQRDKEKFEKQIKIELEKEKEELDNIKQERKNAESRLQYDLLIMASEQKDKVIQEINEWTRSAQEAAEFDINTQRSQLNKEIFVTQTQLCDLQLKLWEYEDTQKVIQQEILRNREKAEKENFYKIQLNQTVITDIKAINEFKIKLNKTDILDKIIYDSYIKKPVDEMIKRVVTKPSISGIYKITRLKTGEIYIGKSVDIKARWQQHAKSCFHCGTISHSLLHTKMEEDGIENFTWEIIEEVPKDKLNEREKYWIEFYQSKQYGLNERIG